MKKLTKVLLLQGLSIFFVGHASAVGVGVGTVYSDLTWSVQNQITGFSTCTELRLDAMGDLTNSDKFSFYGGLNCPRSERAYGITGSGYLARDGSFVMNLTLGLGNSLLCNNIINFSGTCNMYNPAGYYVGAIYITFR